MSFLFPRQIPLFSAVTVFIGDTTGIALYFFFLFLKIITFPVAKHNFHAIMRLIVNLCPKILAERCICGRKWLTGFPAVIYLFYVFFLLGGLS